MNDCIGWGYKEQRQESKKHIMTTTLFSLDPEQQITEYRREYRKLVENMILYAFKDENTELYFGQEVWELSVRCIKSFDPKTGTPFIYYFEKALKKESNQWAARQKADKEVSGLLPPSEYKNYWAAKKVDEWAEVNQVGCNSEEAITRLSKIKNISIDKAAKLMAYAHSNGVQQEYISVEGTEHSLFEKKSDLDEGNTEWGMHPAEESISQEQKINYRLNQIAICYQSLQQRQKRLIKKLLTAKLFDCFLDNQSMKQLLCKMPFYDETIFVECCHIGRAMTDREIADSMGLFESSVSRSWNTFQEKLKHQ